MEYAIHVLHIFGVVITTIAYHLGPNSLHLLLLKSSVVKVRTKKRERERERERGREERRGIKRIYFVKFFSCYLRLLLQTFNPKLSSLKLRRTD